MSVVLRFLPAVLAAATAAHAQVAAPPRYVSPFADYQAYRDEKPAAWRDVNDTAAVLGGHNAHLRDIERRVTLAGTVRDIDRAALRVRIEGDAVRQLGWPAGTAFWPLAAPALADQVKPGQRVSFTLEKDGDAYRVVSFDAKAPPAAPAAPRDPHAGHGSGARR